MTTEQWENVLNRAGAVFNFGIEKKEQLKNSRMAKLIVATPYLAGCNKATETALSHLIIYLISLDESTKDLYFHKPEDNDDIFSRLFPISNFSGGDKDIIKCSMNLIALCMLSNYKKDIKQDREFGKYNPINDGKWDYDSMSETLIQNIDETTNPEISYIYTKEDSLKGYWEK